MQTVHPGAASGCNARSLSFCHLHAVLAFHDIAIDTPVDWKACDSIVASIHDATDDWELPTVFTPGIDFIQYLGETRFIHGTFDTTASITGSITLSTYFQTSATIGGVSDTLISPASNTVAPTVIYTGHDHLIGNINPLDKLVLLFQSNAPNAADPWTGSLTLEIQLVGF